MIGEPRATEPEARPSRAAMLALVVPQITVAAIVILMLGGSLVGSHFFWPVRDVNLSEAVLLRDAGETVRLMERGVDPNATFPVRREVSDPVGRPLTPLEAAVIERRVEMVELLLRHGARMQDAAQTERLICLAAARRAPDVAAFLTAASGRRAPASCPTVQ